MSFEQNLYNRHKSDQFDWRFCVPASDEEQRIVPYL